MSSPRGQQIFPAKPKGIWNSERLPKGNQLLLLNYAAFTGTIRLFFLGVVGWPGPIGEAYSLNWRRRGLPQGKFNLQYRLCHAPRGGLPRTPGNSSIELQGIPVLLEILQTFPRSKSGRGIEA